MVAISAHDDSCHAMRGHAASRLTQLRHRTVHFAYTIVMSNEAGSPLEKPDRLSAMQTRIQEN
jgi:hypothetical protein